MEFIFFLLLGMLGVLVFFLIIGLVGVVQFLGKRALDIIAEISGFFLTFLIPLAFLIGFYIAIGYMIYKIISP